MPDVEREAERERRNRQESEEVQEKQEINCTVLNTPHIQILG